MPLLKFHLDERSPFDQSLRLAKDATLPALEIQLLDQGLPVSLTGATATFSMEDESSVLKVTAAAATISDAANGKVKYEWAAIDVDTTGRFFGQFEITVGSRAYLIPNNESQRLRIIVVNKVE